MPSWDAQFPGFVIFLSLVCTFCHIYRLRVGSGGGMYPRALIRDGDGAYKTYKNHTDGHQYGAQYYEFSDDWGAPS